MGTIAISPVAIHLHDQTFARSTILAFPPRRHSTRRVLSSAPHGCELGRHSHGKESHDVKAPAGYRWLSASAPGVLSTTRMTGSELLPIIRCRGASVRVGPSWIKAYIPYFVRDFPRLDPRGREGREGLEGFEKRHGILDGASGLWRTSAAGGGSWRMAWGSGRRRW